MIAQAEASGSGGKSEMELLRVTKANAITALKQRDQELGAEIVALNKEFGQIKLADGQDRLHLAINQEETFVNNLTQQLRRKQVDLVAGPRVSKVQDAELQKKDMKKQILATIVSPVVVLMGVCMGLAWMDVRQRRVRSAGEVSRGLGIRVVGAVPSRAAPGTPADRAERRAGPGRTSGAGVDRRHPHAAAARRRRRGDARRHGHQRRQRAKARRRWPAIWRAAWPGPAARRCSSTATCAAHGASAVRAADAAGLQRGAARRGRGGRRRAGHDAGRPVGHARPGSGTARCCRRWPATAWKASSRSCARSSTSSSSTRTRCCRRPIRC